MSGRRELARLGRLSAALLAALVAIGLLCAPAGQRLLRKESYSLPPQPSVKKCIEVPPEPARTR